MSMAGPGTVPGYRQCGVPISGTPVTVNGIASAMHSGLRALVLLCIRVHGTRRSGGYRLSGSPVNGIGYAYMPGSHANGILGRYQCQWRALVMHTTWRVPMSMACGILPCG